MGFSRGLGKACRALLDLDRRGRPSPHDHGAEKIERPAHGSRGPSGGLFWIDQEVVTLCGPFGNFRVPANVANRVDQP